MFKLPTLGVGGAMMQSGLGLPGGTGGGAPGLPGLLQALQQGGAPIGGIASLPSSLGGQVDLAQLPPHLLELLRGLGSGQSPALGAASVAGRAPLPRSGVLPPVGMG